MPPAEFNIRLSYRNPFLPSPNDLYCIGFCMTNLEFTISLIQTLLVVVGLVLLVSKSGIFELRAHRRRVEELLERIAQAAESKKP